jgi:hypothetical protein
MNQTLSYFQLIPKSTEVFNNGIQLFNYYNSIYFRTFQQVLKRKETQKADGSSKLDDIEAFYSAWLNTMDKEFDKELCHRCLNILIRLLIYTRCIEE